MKRREVRGFGGLQTSKLIHMSMRATCVSKKPRGGKLVARKVSTSESLKLDDRRNARMFVDQAATDKALHILSPRKQPNGH
jgi:hypothetical protein